MTSPVAHLTTIQLGAIFAALRAALFLLGAAQRKAAMEEGGKVNWLMPIGWNALLAVVLWFQLRSFLIFLDAALLGALVMGAVLYAAGAIIMRGLTNSIEQGVKKS